MTAGPVLLRALAGGTPTDVPVLGVVGAALPVVPFAVANGGPSKTLAGHLLGRADLAAENTFQESNAFAKLLTPKVGLKTATVSDLNPTGTIRDYVHSGFWQFENAAPSLGYPGTGWHNVISASHTNRPNYFALQIASPFAQNSDFFFRNTNNDGAAPWRKIWHDVNLRKGRAIGDVLVFETGAGAPTIVTDGLEFRPLRTVSYANVAVMKDIGPGSAPGDAKTVSCNLLCQTDIREGTRVFNWNALFKITVHPEAYRKYEGGDEPVALGAAVNRHADIPTWCFYTSSYDTTSEPIYPMLGWEKGLSVNGPDPNNVRVMIDMQLNSIDDRPGYNKYGQNEIGCVINISPSLGEPDRVIAKKVIQVKGRNQFILYMADTTDYSRENIVFPGDGFMSWRDKTFKDGNGRDVPGARYATFGWNGQAGSFQWTGMKLLPTSNTNLDYLEMMINGATRFVPSYVTPP